MLHQDGGNTGGNFTGGDGSNFTGGDSVGNFTGGNGDSGNLHTF